MFIKQTIIYTLFLYFSTTQAMMPVSEIKEHYDDNLQFVVIEGPEFDEQTYKWESIINNIELYLTKYKNINKTTMNIFPVITKKTQLITISDILSNNFKNIFEYFENLLPKHLYKMPHKYVKIVVKKIDNVCNSFLDLVEFYEQYRPNDNRFCNMIRFEPKLRKLKLAVMSTFAKYGSLSIFPFKIPPIAESPTEIYE